MSEIHQGPELLQAGQVEKCPKAWLHWEVRGESRRYQLPQEMEEVLHSGKRTNWKHAETYLIGQPESHGNKTAKRKESNLCMYALLTSGILC